LSPASGTIYDLRLESKIHFADLGKFVNAQS